MGSWTREPGRRAPRVPVADLDRFDGLDAHERLRQADHRAFGPTARGCRAPPARRRPPRRSRPRACRPRARPSGWPSFIRSSASGVAHARFEARARSRTAVQGPFRSRCRHIPDRDHVPEHLDAERPEEAPRDASHGRRAAVSRALARSSNVAQIVTVVLHAPGEIGVTGAWPSERRLSSCFRWSRFAIASAMGEPRVSPPRTPERISTRSCSIFMRAPRP